MPQTRIYEETTLTLPNGDVYVFEDLETLQNSHQEDKVRKVKHSMRLFMEYVFEVFPGFNPCGVAGEASCAEDDYLTKEKKKVDLEIIKGGRRPTPEEWEARTQDKLSQIRQERRRDIPSIMFRVSKAGEHVGAMFLDEIHIVGVEGDVNNLSVNVTLALDRALKNNTLWQRTYARFASALLRSDGFLSIKGNPQKFEITRVSLPDVYDQLYTPVNAEALTILDRDPEIEIEEYGTNDEKQNALGIRRIEAITLRPARARAGR